MSLIIDKQTGDPVHYPKRRDVFEFDDEVSQIFENMAVRSIPMYAEMHRTWARFVKWRYDSGLIKYPYRMLDIGSSRGTFYKMLCHEFGVDKSKGLERNHFFCEATDVSEDMVRLTSEEMPWVDYRVEGVANTIANSAETGIRYKIIVLSYVLQFLGGIEYQRSLLARLATHCMREDSFMFIGLKEKPSLIGSHSELERFLPYNYRRFRVENGYSEDEIDFKTEALRNSMTPVPGAIMRIILDSVFVEVKEVVRWGEFVGYICRR